MAVVYFDASALVKLLVTEPGSDVVAALWDGCDAAVSSRLDYPEVCAALAAAGRNRDLEEDALASCRQHWERLWAALRPVELTDGGWAAVEIKLGGGRAVAKAMETLRTMRSRVDTARRGEPARLIVDTAFGHAFQADDGVAVVPLTALRP